MNDLDVLMNTIVSDAMLDEGVAPELLAARGSLVRGKMKRRDINCIVRWTKEEDHYLRNNLGKMPLGEIAKMLGRSKIACKVRFTRKGYPAPSKQPGWISLNAVACLLGVDSHTVPGWFRRGMIPGRYAVTKNREIVVIKIADLKYWATRPRNWPYFKVNKMAPGHLRRLVEKAQVRWGDEWLTTRQVADMHGIGAAGIVTHDIKRGRLPAIQCRHIGGRHEGNWAFWFIKKSDALKYKHPNHSDGSKKAWYTERAEAFLRKLAAQKKNSRDAARLMKQDQKYLSNKMTLIRNEGKK